MTEFPRQDDPTHPRATISKMVNITEDFNIRLKLLTSIERRERENKRFSESDLIHEALSAYFDRPDIADKMLKAAGFEVDVTTPINQLD